MPPVFCFIEVSVANVPIPGKIIIKLFSDDVPKAAENFRALCTGEKTGEKGTSVRYQGTEFHRVIETFIVQGGKTEELAPVDVDEYKETDLVWRDLDEEYLVCMNDMPPKSQFFITLREAPHLNGLNTVVGIVVRGREIVRQISEVDVDDDDRPVDAAKVMIIRSGELEHKGASRMAPVPVSMDVTAVRTGETETTIAIKTTQTELKKDSIDRDRRSKRYHSPRQSRSSESRSPNPHAKDLQRPRSPSPSRSPRRQKDCGKHDSRSRNNDHQFTQRPKSRDRNRDHTSRRYGKADVNNSGSHWQSHRHMQSNKDYNDRHGNENAHAQDEPPPAVIFKGRGNMKYRDTESRKGRL